MLVDSHCHLDFPELNTQLDDIIKRASENDVKIMQTICTRLSKFDDVLNIAKKYDNIYASVGVHPNNVADEPEFTDKDLIKQAQHSKVIGIGETGLDYYYENSPKNKQKECFIQHINAARETGLPLIVHTRDADEDTIDILQSQMKIGHFTGLIHCFSSSNWLAMEAIKLGFYISISGIVTFKNATQLQDSVKEIPLDKILVETDAPYLAPVPHRGKVNEPSFTLHTAQFVADLKEVKLEKTKEVTTQNFFDLFTKAT